MNDEHFEDEQIERDNAGKVERDNLRDSLDHILRVCDSSREQSRRIRWIRKRCHHALNGIPYKAEDFDMPRASGNSASLARAELASMKTERDTAQQQAFESIERYSDDILYLCAQLAEAVDLLQKIEQRVQAEKLEHRFTDLLFALNRITNHTEQQESQLCNDLEQRESLARAEADRDTATRVLARQIDKSAAVIVERDTAQAQLAEMRRIVAGFLFSYDDGVGKPWERPLLDYARKLVDAKEFVAGDAQAEQQEAQPARVVFDEWRAKQEAQGAQGGMELVGYANYDQLDNMLDDRTATLHPKKTGFSGTPVYRARAALATQPAGGEPVAVIDVNAIADYVADHWPMKKHSLEEIESGLRSIVLEGAPPTAAHGDEAVHKDAERYRCLRKKVAIVGAERKSVFHILNLEPRYIAPNPSIEFDAAIDAAMRAQAGEG